MSQRKDDGIWFLFGLLLGAALVVFSFTIFPEAWWQFGVWLYPDNYPPLFIPPDPSGRP